MGLRTSLALLEHLRLCSCALRVAGELASGHPQQGFQGKGVQKVVTWLGEKPQLGRCPQHL